MLVKARGSEVKRRKTKRKRRTRCQIGCTAKVQARWLFQDPSPNDPTCVACDDDVAASVQLTL